MNALAFLAVAVGGGLGAALRLLVDGSINTGREYRLPVGTLTIASLVIVIPLLIAGWFLQRDRILRIAALREGVTGPFPVTGRDPANQVRRDGEKRS